MKHILKELKLNYTHLLYASVLILAIFVIFNLASSRSALLYRLDTLKLQLAEVAADTDTTCLARDTWTANTTRGYQINTDGLDRRFYVHLPQNFNPSKQYPLVMVFTGKGEQPSVIEQSFGINALNAIIVYPQATLGKDKVTAWQGAPYSSSADDIDFINDMLDKVTGQLCIQKNRIYSVGFSNGGGMSWMLSCEASDRIAAFAMVAGAFYYPEKDCHAKQPAAILNIHGDNDHTIPYIGSARRKLPNIDNWAAQRARLNGCSPTPTTLEQRTISKTTTWHDCINNATVQNIRLYGGGHTWPNSMSIAQREEPARSAKMPDILWRFFMSHSL